MKVTRQVARQHELDAWRLRQTGATERRIGDALGLSQQAVNKILRRVERRVLREVADAVHQRKVEQSATLEHIVDEALTAWERSKEPARELVRRPAGGDGAEATVVRLTARCGDVVFLEQARAALADLRKIWGIDTPEKQTVRMRIARREVCL